MLCGEPDTLTERPMLGAGWAKGPSPVLRGRGRQLSPLLTTPLRGNSGHGDDSHADDVKPTSSFRQEI